MYNGKFFRDFFLSIFCYQCKCHWQACKKYTPTVCNKTTYGNNKTKRKGKHCKPKNKNKNISRYMKKFYIKLFFIKSVLQLLLKVSIPMFIKHFTAKNNSIMFTARKKKQINKLRKFGSSDK